MTFDDLRKEQEALLIYITKYHPSPVLREIAESRIVEIERLKNGGIPTQSERFTYTDDFPYRKKRNLATGKLFIVRGVSYRRVNQAARASGMDPEVLKRKIWDSKPGTSNIILL